MSIHFILSFLVFLVSLLFVMLIFIRRNKLLYNSIRYTIHSVAAAVCISPAIKQATMYYHVCVCCITWLFQTFDITNVWQCFVNGSVIIDCLMNDTGMRVNYGLILSTFQSRLHGILIYGVRQPAVRWQHHRFGTLNTASNCIFDVNGPSLSI